MVQRIVYVLLLVVCLCLFRNHAPANGGLNFDRLKEEDRRRFSARFAKEIWPLFKRNGKDGCAGCHTPRHRSGLKFTGNADTDFRYMLKEGFLLPDDPGSIWHLVKSRNPRERMPPGNRPRWSREEIEKFHEFIVDVDKKQQRRKR